MADFEKLKKLCQLIRYDILTSTTEAKSGHPTSSLSAVELMTVLFFAGFFKSDLRHPSGIENDRFILSKGHASPLLYSLYHAAGLIDYKELMTLRKFGSRLEGHPTPRLPYIEVATGSLGQGLSVGVGMALGIKLRSTIDDRKWKIEVENRNLKIEKNQPSTFDLQHPSSIINHLPSVFVLLGDSEMAEGQVWEAMEIAGYYKLSNLIGIIDVNRLGQYGETQEGWDIHDYEKKAKAFGWETIVINDGHDINQVFKAFNKALKVSQSQFNQLKPVSDSTDFNRFQPIKPIMIIARTIKGKGVSFLENKEGWHGKALDKNELKMALKDLGKIDYKVRGTIKLPKSQILNPKSQIQNENLKSILFKLEKFSTGPIATREAYGDALVDLGEENPNIVVLDAEVGNSTFENKFQQRFPERFFEMFIAEENMMSVALGLSKIGYIPFVSTFAAFLTQTFDQVRMAQYSKGNIKIVGSHAGVSIGADGPSQMGLEDIAMMKSILNSVIFYPSDAVSANKLTKIMAKNPGIFYMRTTRGKTPVIYHENEEFEIGGIKVHNIKSQIQNLKSKSKISKLKTLIVAAGITLHEALKAQKELAKENIITTVIDLYCVKPLNSRAIEQLIKNHSNIIVVEDHYPFGGIGEAISGIITNYGLRITNFVHLAVKKIPMSATPEELLRFEEIDSQAIIKAVKSF